MALFRKKPPDDGDNDNPADANGEFTPDPERARQFFEHAKKAAMTSNFDYALSCFAEGLRLDPESMAIHEAMKDAGVRYMSMGGRAASGRDIRKLDGAHPIHRFVAAEFAWMKDYGNSSLATKALDAAIKAEQLEWGHWAADQVLALTRRNPKVGKSTWLTLMRLFLEVHAFDHAMFCGNQAQILDPTDNTLAHELKNISAERAMDQGRYEEAGGKEGGFKGMVKDFDKQRELEESERLTTSDSATERNLERAKAAYEEQPAIPDLINKYALLLKKQGTPEDLQKAHDVYIKGHEVTGEYRFRMNAGDINIDTLRQSQERCRKRLESDPDDAALKAKLEEAHLARVNLEASELKERAEKYPTDRRIRFRLGELSFELDDMGAAMEHLQAARDEPKLKVRAHHLLGQCFALEHWHTEAVEEFKEALTAIDVADKERELDIRYDMMLSMIIHARAEKDPGLAREAREICSGIARKNIAYRDIREKRKEVETLIKELTSGEGAG